MNSAPGLVGNSFKMGYRFQRYWDTSMALAFFSAETGAGLFAVSAVLGQRIGMIVGLVMVATLKPYFHLAHMGVPAKSWRAIIRPDRSWISRGAIGIVLLVGFGALHLLLRGAGPVGLVVEIMAIAAALLVMCYQGFAMAHSESFALWANPLVPAASLCYALTAGLLLTWTLSDGSLGAIEQNLRLLSVAALVADVLILVSLLTLAGRKSRGGAFSAHLLTRGEYAAPFWGLTVLLGLALPLGLTVLLPTPTPLTGIVIAAAAMLSGFLALRILLFKAAVYEPIANDIIGSLGLSMLRS